MNKICIAVVDCIDSNAFRVAHPSSYIPKEKKTEEEKHAEMKAKLKDWGWPRDEEEQINLTDFNRIVKKLGKRDEFKVGYLTVSDDIGKPFFNNPETQQLFAKNNPRIINRDEYQHIINEMRKMIADNYFKILQDRHNWQGILETKMEMWESPHEFPYNLDTDTYSMVNGHNPEFQIWDLVRMYKSIDWMRDNVVIYEW